jgi:NADH-quinone oxidoreductase subunit G
MVKKARAGVMEFLLINHPLDCPICDQGGECDLQDQAVAYGLSFSRYREPKRAMEDLELGPLVETHMNRCISCTRCVRFTTEIAGITQMGRPGAGEDSEITSYLNETLASNLQGNIIDLCPVGALVSKPYAYKGRPWELVKTESVDVMDALGSNIRVDSKGREVMRILPRNHDGVNEEWISDKTRFVWDGLRRQRLDTPYLRENGRLRKASWGEALGIAAQALRSGKVAGLVGDLAPVEAAFALKDLMARVGGTVECRTDGARLVTSARGGYAGNARIGDIEDAKSILLIGTNPRTEAPVLNARIRGAWLRGRGRHGDWRARGPHLRLSPRWRRSRGIGALRPGRASSRGRGGHPGAGCPARCGRGGGYGPRARGRPGSGREAPHPAHRGLARGRYGRGLLDRGRHGRPGGRPGRLVAGRRRGRDRRRPLRNYQGSHGDRGAHRADLILPAAAWTEESGLFVNTEGRPQLALRAGFAPGEAKENWAILRAVSAAIGSPQPWDSLPQLRQALVAAHPVLAEIDTVPENRLPHLPPRRMGEADVPQRGARPLPDQPHRAGEQLMGELSSMERGQDAAGARGGMTTRRGRAPRGHDESAGNPAGGWCLHRPAGAPRGAGS